MAVKLNLLPPELAVSKTLSTTLKTLKMLGVILLALFLVFAVGVSAFFVISSITLNSLTANVTTLKTQINAQEVSEQQLVLLKDRLKKITTVQTTPSSLPNLITIDPFLSGLSSDSSVSELNVDPQKIDTAINFRSNSDLTSFIKSLTDSNTFKSVTISSFGLNPVNGYLVGMSVVTK